MSHIYCNSLVVMISFVVPYIYGSNPPPPSPTIYLSKIKNKNDNSNSRTFYTWMFKLGRVPLINCWKILTKIDKEFE